MADVKVILINATDKILEQVDEKLGKFALQKLKEIALLFSFVTVLLAVIGVNVILIQIFLVPLIRTPLVSITPVNGIFHYSGF